MSRTLNKFEIPIERFAIYDDKIENDLKLLENESEVVVRDKPEEEKEIIEEEKEIIKEEPIKKEE